jgi:hypothetical protein
MAHQSKELLLAWKSLPGADPKPGWQAISLTPVGSIEIQAGKRSPDNVEALLLSFPKVKISSTEKLPEGQGFSVERTSSSGRECTQLALTRKPAGSPELFETMAHDVITTLESASTTSASPTKLLRIFLSRVGAWQEFMRKGSVPLTPENEVGLVGELKLLSRLIEAGIPVNIAVDAWTGPTKDGLRDFSLGAGAIEAKTTISSNGFVAKIGSLEQLDDTHCKPLFLAALKFVLVESGQTLPELVTDVSGKVAIYPFALAELENRLLSASYLAAHAHHYHRRFSYREERILEVEKDFPSMTHGNVKQGVISARYEINLESLLSQDIGLKIALAKLGVI